MDLGEVQHGATILVSCLFLGCAAYFWHNGVGSKVECFGQARFTGKMEIHWNIMNNNDSKPIQFVVLCSILELLLVCLASKEPTIINEPWASWLTMLGSPVAQVRSYGSRGSSVRCHDLPGGGWKSQHGQLSATVDGNDGMRRGVTNGNGCNSSRVLLNGGG